MTTRNSLSNSKLPKSFAQNLKTIATQNKTKKEKKTYQILTLVEMDYEYKKSQLELTHKVRQYLLKQVRPQDLEEMIKKQKIEMEQFEEKSNRKRKAEEHISETIKTMQAEAPKLVALPPIPKEREVGRVEIFCKTPYEDHSRKKRPAEDPEARKAANMEDSKRRALAKRAQQRIQKAIKKQRNRKWEGEDHTEWRRS